MTNNPKPITSEKEIRTILDRLFFETEAAGSVEKMFQLRDIAIMQLDELFQSAYSQGEQATAKGILADINEDLMPWIARPAMKILLKAKLIDVIKAKYLSGEDKDTEISLCNECMKMVNPSHFKKVHAVTKSTDGEDKTT